MKPTYLHAAERIDLGDAVNMAVDYPTAMRDRLLRVIHGSGVLQGFRIEVLANKGQIDVYNGVGMDGGGSLINAETGTTKQRVVLTGLSKEFWLEIEFLWAEADPDSRAFFDPLVANTAPIPAGQEVDIPRTMTRLVPAWRIKHPIRQNAAGRRDEATNPGYSPAGFSDSDQLVIPIAVIRTNTTGEIQAGNPDTDDFGNDIIQVNFSGGAKKVIKAIGYGESSVLNVGGTNMKIGRKSTDQRPRVYERLEPPFLHGNTSETIGAARTDHWAVSQKSAWDHITTQISHLVNGVDTAPYYEGLLSSHDPTWNWIEIDTLLMEAVLNPLIPPDMFLNWTAQIRQGPWSGFYAQVQSSSRLSAGVYRLYLRNHSEVPTYWPLPNAAADSPIVRLVQHRKMNWLEAPTPSSGYRGYNALDDEVVAARADIHTTKVFTSLKGRLDGEKSHELVLGITHSNVLADYQLNSASLGTITAIQTAMGIFTANATPDRGGRCLFRKGTYDVSLLGGSALYTLFSVVNGKSLIFEGAGREKTVLKFTTGAVAQNHILFDMSGCSDIEFRNMTFWGRGTILNLSGCENVRFVNCSFIAEYDGSSLARPALSLGATSNFVFDHCTFSLSGQGVVTSTMAGTHVRNCTFAGLNHTATELDSLWLSTGSVSQTFFTDCSFIDPVTTSCMKLNSNCDRLTLVSVKMNTSVLSSSARGVFDCAGDMSNSRFTDSEFGNNTSASPYGIRLQAASANNSIQTCLIQNISLLGITAISWAGVHISNTRILCSAARPAGSVGLSLFAVTKCMFHNIEISNFETGINKNTSVFTDSRIERCHIYGVVDGIYLNVAGALYCENNYICDNNIRGVSITTNFGIRMESGLNNVVSGNTVDLFQRGISLKGDAVVATISTIIRGNNAFSTTIGFDLQYLTGSVASGNLAKDAITYGFDLTKANVVNFSGNHVQAAAVTAPYFLALAGLQASKVRGGMVDLTGWTNPWAAANGDGTNGNEVALYNTWDGVFTPANIAAT